MQARVRKSRRTANACVACRQSKIKCSGVEPCHNCQRREVRCEFAEGSAKVLVSERYLRQLEAKARYRRNNPDHTPTPVEVSLQDKDTHAAANPPLATPDASLISPGAPSRSPPPTGHSCDIWTSPFTLPSSTIKNSQENSRNWIWLAPSSMWSFTARLTILMKDKLHHEYPYDAPILTETEIYPIRWEPASTRGMPDITDLPSMDFAFYLFDTVKFHLGQSYRLFDEAQFFGKLQQFYHGDPATVVAENRLWFVQYLLVVAFGTALLSRSTREQPPGSRFFIRAMSLMPDYSSLWKDSIIAVEVSAMAALYLHSIDQRESAFLYLGQAIRIAQFEGLHTQLSETELGSDVVARCRNLWWTLYIMDRHFSYSVGLSMTTNDSEISTLIDSPSTCSIRDVVLTLQAKLSQSLSFILTSVYKHERTSLDVFLEKTRSILHTLAGHAQEVEQIIHLRFRNSVDTMPSGTRHITLLYHQCVIVATRPLLLSALIERLKNLDSEREDWQGFLSLTKALISAGIKSAVKTLQILSGNGCLVEAFLPYDLEFTYAAAIHLAMANALFPQVDHGQSFCRQAHSILDDMINNGNRIAQARKEQLVYLERLFQELASRAKSQGLQLLTLTTPEYHDATRRTEDFIENESSAPGDGGDGSMPPLVNSAWMGPSAPEFPHTLEATEIEIPSVELLSNIGISSAEFFSIVDNIGILDHSHMFDYGSGSDEP